MVRSPNSLIVITGGMGAGKTSVLAEASDLLRLLDISHAAIDLDALGLSHLTSAPRNEEVMYSNLRSVCDNYAALGVSRFLLARAVENRTELEACSNAVSASDVAVCRLLVRPEIMRQRLQRREVGLLRNEFLVRADKLNAILDEVHLEDFSVSNDDRPLTEVGREMLIHAGWISG